MHDQSPCIDLGQLESVYAPLAESIRRLIDVSIRTEAEPAAVAAATGQDRRGRSGIERDGAAGARRRAPRPRRPDHRVGQRGGRCAQPGGTAAGDPTRPRRSGVVGIHSGRGLRRARPAMFTAVSARWCSTMCSARRRTSPAGPPTPAPSPCATGAEPRWSGRCGRRLMSSAPRASRRSPLGTWPMRTASRWKRRASSSTRGSRRPDVSRWWRPSRRRVVARRVVPRRRLCGRPAGRTGVSRSAGRSRRPR